MDWTYPAVAGEAGIFEIGRRLAIHLGRLPDATSFIHDAREMLRVTRRMESAALSGMLLAGFQNAAKFDLEATRYRDLAAGGTRVTVYGTSRPSQSLTYIDYREVAPDSRKLENQWFLVSDAPEPIAFVSWELGDASGFGVGGAAAEGKRFVGFVSDDPEVVSELVDALGRVPGLVTATAAAAETGISSKVDEWALAIVSAVEGIVPPETDRSGFDGAEPVHPKRGDPAEAG